MKKYLVIIFLLFSFSACIKEYETETEYRIHNQTNHKIDIFVSNYSLQNYYTLDTTFTVNQGARIEHSYLDRGKNSPYLYPFGFRADEVIIYFDDAISVRYTNDDNQNRNPLKIENYSGGIKTSNNNGLYYYIYEYTITDEDYKNAVDRD